MFISGLVLRYKKPDVKRSFKIPGKRNSGMWIAALFGVIGSIFAIITGFLPPNDLKTSNEVFFFEAFQIGGVVLFTIIPVIIHKIRRPSWHLFKSE